MCLRQETGLGHHRLAGMQSAGAGIAPGASEPVEPNTGHVAEYVKAQNACATLAGAMRLGILCSNVAALPPSML